ncbi:deoxyribose-phosphate aldolase [Oceanibium sediminis]|uniref:deoxyribose-phosphate aldolase n=1 Tax=Oceanibium sediminis TaxID=2026339 RepID=UPI000DD2C307|nr:deoxyribose-phosphate aldolase [Oceanibium sediminis]
MTEDPLRNTARRGLASLDLTDLDEDSSEQSVRELCARAVTPHGPVAAVCVWPQFVPVAVNALRRSGVRVCTVMSYPEGDHPTAEVLDMTAKAVADGAQEIDLVIPYKGLMEGHPNLVQACVSRVKEAAGSARLKAILESGVLGEAELIRTAAELSIEGGADFIKTSTGKVPVNATPEAARVILEVIKAKGGTVGLKPSGGIHTTADAKVYLDLCDEVMGPDWATPSTFRIGASSVLDAFLDTLDETTSLSSVSPGAY